MLTGTGVFLLLLKFTTSLLILLTLSLLLHQSDLIYQVPALFIVIVNTQLRWKLEVWSAKTNGASTVR